MVDACKNCGAALKVGMFSANQALSARALAVINLAGPPSLGDACNQCGDDLYKGARASLTKEAQALRSELKAMLPSVPVVSLQQPMGWSYKPITIITAQTVTGTGIFSDVASAFTDLFGTQSGTYNAKLREGEDLCKASLRAQALEVGANAVVAVDVDYAEVGGQRAMLMVCMTGTAVKLQACSEYVGGSFDAKFAPLAEASSKAERVRRIEATLQESPY